MGIETKKTKKSFTCVLETNGPSRPRNFILGKLIKKYDCVNPLAIKLIKRNIISSPPRN
jgi:hypothetical protein